MKQEEAPARNEILGREARQERAANTDKEWQEEEESRQEEDEADAT